MAIIWPERFLEADQLLRHGIEKAGSLLERGAAVGCAAPLAKQILEHNPRVSLCRQRRCRRGPREIVLIDAGIAVVALADDGKQVH
jgi:hypothetical protein